MSKILVIDHKESNLLFISKILSDFLPESEILTSKEKERFDIIQIIEETLSIVQAELEKNFISLQFSRGKFKSLSTIGYSNKFKQVILNIINNAKNAILERKMEDQSLQRGYIAIDISSINGKIKINLENNGGRIPPEIQDRIFEPYFTTREKKKGTGIGLYMSKTIIEKHMDGKLYVENAEKGAIFAIELKKEGSIEKRD